MSELIIGDRAMPEPRSILAVLKDQLNAAVLTERQRRGPVSDVADTYEMHRSLAAVEETCGEYSRAFQAVQREARSVAEEELGEVFGEQDGIPNDGTTVPCPDGTEVRVTRQFANVWTADENAVMAAVAYQVLETFTEEVEGLTECEAQPETDAARNTLANLLIIAMQRYSETGKYEPQVTKVKALVKEMAGVPAGDRVAATVAASLKKTQQYKGVKIERVQPKGK
jgi:hypothetical protein